MGEVKIGKAATYGEPWRIDDRDFGLVDSKELEVEVGLPEFDRRIIACVNACAGMDDPAAEIESLRARLEWLGKFKTVSVGRMADGAYVNAWNEPGDGSKAYAYRKETIDEAIDAAMSSSGEKENQ